MVNSVNATCTDLNFNKMHLERAERSTGCDIQIPLTNMPAKKY